MKGCVFVTGRDGQPGFALAGFRQETAEADNLLEVVAGLLENSDPGLIFIDERLLDDKSLGQLRRMEKEWGGAIIALPAPLKGDVPAGEDVGRRLITRVLGYQIKLN